MINKKNYASVITIFLAVIVVIISFTPLVIPSYTFKPQLFGLPYSLWMGLLATLLMVILTYISTRVHPEGRQAKKSEKRNRMNND